MKKILRLVILILIILVVGFVIIKYADTITGWVVRITKVNLNENINCVFSNSTSVVSCLSAKGSCSGVGSCSVSITGKRNTILNWTSSCSSQVITTIIDGKNETITFNCAPLKYYKAYWKCYDGYSINATSKNSLDTSSWNNLAQQDCIGHCGETSCGVSLFNVN